MLRVSKHASHGERWVDCIREIISQDKQCLKPQGWLMLGHGYDQATQVTKLMKNSGFSSVTSIADLSGILRVALGKSKQKDLLR